MSNIKSDGDLLESSLQSVQDLVIKIATHFSNTSSDNFNHDIIQVFSDLGLFLGLSRVSLIQYQIKENIMKKTHEWCNQNIASGLELFKEIPMEIFEDCFVNKHFHGEPCIVQDVSKFNENKKLHHILSAQGILAIATEPIFLRDTCFGFVSFEDNNAFRQWNEIDTKLLKMISKMITNTLVKISFQMDITNLEEQVVLANQAMGEFLFKMSHEIRTPLSGVYNSIYLLGSTNLSIEQKEYLEIGQASIDVMSSIVDGILDLSKIESGRMEIFSDKFNLEEELIRIYRVQKTFADDKGIALNLDFDYRINCELIGDYRKLRQIILNLINNAIEYTHEGYVSLKSQLVQNKDRMTIEFDIIDTGIGIEETHIKKISKAFYQIDSIESSKLKGTGLGLSVTNELVHLMGGELDIASKLNYGSTIKVKLTFDQGQRYDYSFGRELTAIIISDHIEACVSKDLLESMGISVKNLQTIGNDKCDLFFFESQVTDEKALLGYLKKYGNENAIVISLFHSEQKKFKSINLYIDFPISRQILFHKLMNVMDNPSKEPSEDLSYMSILNGYALIVDDNRLNRIALESILTKEGIRSKSVNSGSKAIEAVQKESFDLVLMDVQMPVMDGVETTRRIRNLGEKYDDLPIIAVTANAFLSDYDFMKTSRMNDIIFKPIRVKNLSQILRKYIKASASIRIPDELFIFDQKDFEIRFEGSLDIAEEVIESFIKEYVKDLHRIKIAIEDKNPNKIIEATHYFKGSCAYLSGKRTVWLLNYILNAARNEHMDMMSLCYNLLEKEISDLLKAIMLFQK
ncbi:MAG: response regulator [Firmicutes bacterium]|nr:response regulator [Bacillota bacterium]